MGTNYIVDAFDGSAEFSGVTKTVKWYQFKIPISEFESNVGGIEGFNSIRFMRVYMKGFDRPILVRLARFELVRSDWRRYQFDLKQPGEYLAVDQNAASFDISAVSLQENSTKVPVNYVMPPQINQQQNVQTTNLVLLNEQALQMRVCNLRDGDSRAIFKNVDLDTRMYGNMKMNVHAEPLTSNGIPIPLKDGDLTLFFRVGTDYNNNFYEYEIPLNLTPKGVYDPNSTDARNAVWPNEVNFNFNDISRVKDARNTKYGYFSDLNQLSTPFSQDLGGYTVTIVGNPNLGTVKSIMVGIRNPKGTDNLAHCAEVWINELRLTDFNNKGGWAATGQMQAKLADLGMLSVAGTYKTPFWGSVESKVNDRSKETNANWDVSTSINGGKFFPAKWKVTLPVFYNYGQTKITPLFNPLDPDVKMSAINDIDISKDLKNKIKDETIDFTERKGFNLTNVRVDGLKRPKAKPRPWDISNFSVTYAYTEIFKRSVNVEYNINKQYRGNIQYSYSIKNPLTIKPFIKVKIFQNKWFALIKDFSLQLVPSSFGTSIDANRSYAAVKNRDITGYYAGSDAFANQSLINKNFIMNRSYNFVWPFNKSLKFDYSAVNEGRILEPYGEILGDRKIDRDSVINTFFHGKVNKESNKTEGRFGENTTYRQQMNLTADLPLSKIPILDFVKSTYRFSGTYTWSRRPFAANDSIGNTIQNTRSHNFTGNFNLVQLYNKVPYLKRINNPPPKTAVLKPAGITKAVDKPGAVKNNSVASPDSAKKSNFDDILQLLAKTLMMLKSASITYQLSGGQAMPNFVPSSQYGGMDFRNQQAPGFLFTTGLQDDNIRQNSAQNGWISKVAQQTTPYTENYSKTYSYRASIEPHGSLKIELTGNYTKSQNLTEYLSYDHQKDSSNAEGYIKGYSFHNSPSITGNFNMSTFTLFNSFKDGKDPIESNLFKEFLSTRADVANELAAKNDINNVNHPGFSNGRILVPATSSTSATSYVDGYSNNQQDVLLGAFYRTYTGRNIKNYNTQNIFPKTPLPNWTITWDGLGKIPTLKKTFKSIMVRHTYKSTYNINGYANNILYNTAAGTQNERMPVSTSSVVSSNFVPYYTIGSVTMSERYEPLIKFDFQFVRTGWSANVETRRDKTTTLNLTGFQIIETKGQEYILGAGYRIDKLKLNIKIQGKPIQSPLTIKVDLSYRKNVSIIRQVESGISTPTGGTNIITLRSSADYILTPNITLRLFYDWVKTIPQTSASFPTSSINGGFSLRITFQ